MLIFLFEKKSILKFTILRLSNYEKSKTPQDFQDRPSMKILLFVLMSSTVLHVCKMLVKLSETPCIRV